MSAGSSELAPGRQRDLHLAQSRNGGAPAPGVNDLGLNEEAHRAGPFRWSGRAREGLTEPGREKAAIIKSYYHWNNRIFGRAMTDMSRVLTVAECRRGCQDARRDAANDAR